MTRSSIVSFLLGVVVAAVIYEATGLRVTGGHAPEAMASKPPVSGAARPAGVAPRPAPAPVPGAPTSDTGQVAGLRAEASDAKARAAFAEQQLEAVEGRAIPWPANVAPQFKKEAVEQQLKEFVVDRGLATIKSMDCSEYPCVEVLQLTDTGPDAPKQFRAALGEMVKRYYGGNVLLSIQGSRTERGSNTVSLAGVGVVPNEDDVKARARHRAQQALDEHGH